MMLCPACGASWECEHLPDPNRALLEYMPPDAPTPRSIMKALFSEPLPGPKDCPVHLGVTIPEEELTRPEDTS